MRQSQQRREFAVNLNLMGQSCRAKVPAATYKPKTSAGINE